MMGLYEMSVAEGNTLREQVTILRIIFLYYGIWKL